MTTRILVVDDSSADRLMIKSMLGHYTVQTASNGQEGLAILEAEGPFDMVILDINMPVMNGFEFLEIIKEKGLLRNLRVMILTNYDENDNEIRGL
ncbi:response regulator, partial [Proteiniclasticum sp.]